MQSRTARALAIAASLVALVNGWVGWRLPQVVPESSIDTLIDLERRVSAYPYRKEVKVLVFGNSHAITGLRPPAIARALGLPPQAVFSLALPSGSPFEMQLLAERYLPSFPQAKVAVCGVEEFFLAESVDMRLRYLTRQDPGARWRYAAHARPLEEQAALVAGVGFPVFDFATPLREAAVKRPNLTLQRLIWDRPAVAGTDSAALMGRAYPWGSPPVMDAWAVPDVTQPAFLRTRSYLLVKNAGRIPTGLADLEALVRSLEDRGLQVSLTGLPYSVPLLRTLEREFPEYARSRRQVASYMATSGRQVWPAPVGWDQRCFTDADHMTPLGAARMADRLFHRLPEALRRALL